MRGFVGSGALWAIIVMALWRGGAELAARHQVLLASGELQVRLAAKRRHIVTRALAGASAECSRVRAESALSPVPVPVEPRIHRSVHVGSVRGSDVDDVGLLEGAMRRAAQERIDSDGIGLGRARRTSGSAPTHLDQQQGEWGWLAAEPLSGADEVGPLPQWAVPLAALGVCLTLLPLIRPLSDGAPWLVLAGVTLVGAGWFAARRR